MRTITLEELLEAGCHFGHQVTRQNPKARDYVFEARDGIHIIDLAKTKEGLDEAAAYVKKIASMPDSTMIILGAKRQAQALVKEEVARANTEGATGLYSVTNRWIGGILTNFQEVSKNFKRLIQLTANLKDKHAQSGYTKKEISLWDREKQKLESFYGGIFEMKKEPNALFVIDTNMEQLAVKEAIATRIQIVGITDTNADPTIINHAIPANDDAVGSIQLIVHHIVDAWIEGKKKMASDVEQIAKESELKVQSEKLKVEKGEETEVAEVKIEKKVPAEKKTVKKTTKKAEGTK